MCILLVQDIRVLYFSLGGKRFSPLFDCHCVAMVSRGASHFRCHDLLRFGSDRILGRFSIDCHGIVRCRLQYLRALRDLVVMVAKYLVVIVS